MPSAISRWLRFLLPLLILTAAAGCREDRLPDPQVVALPTGTVPLPTETAIPTREITPTPEPAAPVPTETPAAIVYDVPVVPQDGLLLNGAPTGVGCVPACIEMITAWWHSTADKYPVLTAQETIDRNAEQGLYIAGRGMTSASAADELAELGYVHRMELNSSKEELLEAFRQNGPVGVLVKTNWVPTTMNHAAVLTAYDPVSDLLTFNDPFYGSTVQWSWESFDGIWGLNYAGDRDYAGSVVQRVFFTIFPEKMH